MNPIFCVLCLGALFSPSSQSEDLNDLFDRIHQRINGYEEVENLRAEVETFQTEFNSKWEPKKRVEVKKTIEQYDDNYREIIHWAAEFKKGKKKDVTEEYRKEEAERQESVRKRREAGNDGGEAHSFHLAGDELFPFSPEKRDAYEYSVLPDTIINGHDVMGVRARCLEKERDQMEGDYYFDRRTLDVICVKVKPSKNPKMVKEMAMEFHFQVLQGKYLVMNRYWMRIYASAIVKKFRMEMEEIYSQIQVEP